MVHKSMICEQMCLNHILDKTSGCLIKCCALLAFKYNIQDTLYSLFDHMLRLICIQIHVHVCNLIQYFEHTIKCCDLLAFKYKI